MGNMKLPSPDSHCGGGIIIYSSEYVLAALGEVPSATSVLFSLR